MIRTRLFLATVAVAMGASATSALANAPAWTVISVQEPTIFGPADPSGKDRYAVEVVNTGDATAQASENQPITITDALPAGITATGIEGRDKGRGFEPLICHPETLVCESFRPIPPGSLLREEITVEVAKGTPSGEPNSIRVSGGGALLHQTFEPTILGSTPASFGLSNFLTVLSSSLAGAHPNLTTSFTVNQILTPFEKFTNADEPAAPIRQVQVNVPAGIIGNASVIPRCTVAQVNVGTCPAAAAVGIGFATLSSEGSPISHSALVYNVVPYPGEPAAFMFDPESFPVRLDASVRTGADDGIRISIPDIRETQPVLSSTVTLWGVPAEHNGPSAQGKKIEESDFIPLPYTYFGGPGEGARTPFLTNPTQCNIPLSTNISIESWLPAFAPQHAESSTPAPTGCTALSFEPSFSAAPDTSSADTPAGLTFDLKLPQEGLLNANGLGTANLQDTTVTLPEGIAINPGQAAGLQACPFSQDAVGTEAAPSCPPASKVGTVTITTPLLPDKLEGTVYILPPNPPNLQLLVAASADGVNLKLIGNVHLDPSTGQLTTTFDETPQLPFTDFKLSFSGGAQAALTTPSRCGVYTTTADFTPWSSPFTPDADNPDSFQIASGPLGSACSSPLPFSPSLTAGSTTDQAGGFTDFSLLLQRGDGQQRVSTLRFKTPEGLLGMIGKVPLCGEPQAAQGACPGASQIGHTVVTAGPGPYPLVVPGPGDPPAPIFLTGPYRGAPYGLSIAVPVVAGPFNLGTVVVRASIAVDPHTAQLTVTTDPLPSILDGVPTDLRTINAVIDRAGFMFNPTDCNATSFSGVAVSGEGASAPISSRFQVGSCRSLKFKPDFVVSTSGRTSMKRGASLDAKVIYPTETPEGGQATSQANIASVKVELPKRLPSRLTTLQKACAAATFEANPAACPAASLVGHATAVTPVLPVRLSGPAYFVSHGGEAFPSLIVVLQGDGVTVELVGATFISKKSITSSTFKSVPDVPIASFDLTLPEGPHSALAANGNLCKGSLRMPTTFTAQNGAVIRQSTRIRVSGCPRGRGKA